MSDGAIEREGVRSMESHLQVLGFETDDIPLIPQWFQGREGVGNGEREIFYNLFPNHLATHCWGKIYKSPSLHAHSPNSSAFPKPILSESVSQVENGKLRDVPAQ